MTTEDTGAVPPVTADRSRANKAYGVLAGLMFFGVVLAILVLLPFKYDAQLDVLVRVTRDAAPAPQVGGVGSDQIVVTGVRPEDVATEIALLTGRPVAEAAYDALGPAFFLDIDEPAKTFRQRLVRLVKTTVEGLSDAIKAGLVRLKLMKLPSPREESITDLMDGLQVSKSVRSDLISVSFRWGSPKGAVAALSAISGAYYAAHREARAVFRGRDLFAGLRTDAERQLAAMAADIEARKTAAGVFNAALWIDQKTRIVAQLDQELAAATREKAQLAIRSAQIARDRAGLAARPLTSEALHDSDILSAFRDRLGAIGADLERDRARFGAAAPQVQEGEAILRALRADMRAADLAQSDRDIRAVQADLELAEGRVENLRAQIAAQRADIAAVSQTESEIRTLETRRAAIEQNLAQLSLEAARSDWLSALDAKAPSGVSILQPLTVSDAPVAPNKVLILMVALVLAVALGVGVHLGLSNLSRIRVWARSPVAARPPEGGVPVAARLAVPFEPRGDTAEISRASGGTR